MKAILLLLAPILLLTASCKREDPDYDMYFVDGLMFGTYYGMCAKNCVNMYEVRASYLHKDDSVKYTDLTWSYKFTNTRPLDDGRLGKAKVLLNEVPKELFEKNNYTYGSPDSHDQGGLYIRVETMAGYYKFKIDMDNTPDQPAAVVAFKQKVLAVIKQLQ